MPLVPLQNILNSENYVSQEGDYVAVNSVWNSGVSDHAKFCHFILSDGESYIAAVLHLEEFVLAKNVAAVLQNEFCRFKLRNFRVENIQQENGWRPLKGQDKQLKLSENPEDVFEVPRKEENLSRAKFYRHLPFQFTSLDDLKNCEIGQVIDIIGIVRQVAKAAKSNNDLQGYQNIIIASSRSTAGSKILGCQQELSLLGNYIGKITKKTPVHALMNVEVAQRFHKEIGYKYLRTTENTLICKVGPATLHKIPPKYRSQELVQRLLPRQRKPKQSLIAKTCESKRFVPYKSSKRPVIPSTSSTFPGPGTLQDSTTNAHNAPSPLAHHSQNTSFNLPQILMPGGSVIQRNSENVGNFSPRSSIREGQDRSPMQNSIVSSKSDWVAYQSPGGGFGVTPNRITTELSNQRTVDNKISLYSNLYARTSPAYLISNNDAYSGPSQDSHNDSHVDTTPTPNVQYAINEELSGFDHVDYDFVNDNLPLDVIVKPSTCYMDEFNAQCYPMRANPRGIALIILNYTYRERDPCDDEHIRSGSNKDMEYLRKVFEAFQFKVDFHIDVAAWELQKYLDEFKEKATENMNAVIVVILSHGTHGLIEMVDGKFVRLPNDIIRQFDAHSFPVMAGKPKLFIVQTCQDIPSEENVRQIFPPSAPCREQERRDNVELENMLVCYAAAPGMPAARHQCKGSYFIYVLCHTMMEHSHNTDFLTLLKLVQHRLKTVRRNDKNILHCDWMEHSFVKKLYFNPGL